MTVRDAQWFDLRASWWVVALLACSCAAQRVRPTAPPSREYTFAGLQGQHVSVEVVDRGRLFDSHPGVVSATKQAVAQQLSSHGVVVDDASGQRKLVLELAAPATAAYSAQSCVQVTGRLESTAQAFLPSQESTATRCGGKGPGVGPADPFIAIMLVVGAAVNAADGATAKREDRELAEGLSEALADVLGQVDARTR